MRLEAQLRKRVLQRLKELFDAPVQSKTQESTPTHTRITFSVKTPQEVQNYTVDFDQWSTVDELTENPEHEKYQIWEVSFAYIRGLGKTHEYDYEITGEGDAKKVFATILQIVRNFVISKRPAVLFMTADLGEPSRVRFYKSFAKLVANKVPYTAFSKLGFYSHEDEKNEYYIFVDNRLLPIFDNVEKVKL